MSDIRLNLSIREENSLLFKRCIRRLLEATFIVGDRDGALYAYISRESNRQDVSDYLRMIGFDVLVDTNVRVAMLRPHEADEEAVGLKRANVVTFTAEQYHLLLVLWEVYLETVGTGSENVVTRGDLIDRIRAYEVDVDKTRLSASMRIFKRYSLIDYDARDESEEAPVTLYPSLQFGWDIPQFRTVAAEYMNRDRIDAQEQERGAEEEGSDGWEDEG